MQPPPQPAASSTPQQQAAAAAAMRQLAQRISGPAAQGMGALHLFVSRADDEHAAWDLWHGLPQQPQVCAACMEKCLCMLSVQSRFHTCITRQGCT